MQYNDISMNIVLNNKSFLFSVIHDFFVFLLTHYCVLNNIFISVIKKVYHIANCCFLIVLDYYLFAICCIFMNFLTFFHQILHYKYYICIYFINIFIRMFQIQKIKSDVTYALKNNLHSSKYQRRIY